MKVDQLRMNEAIKYRLEQVGKDDPHAYSRENNLVYVVALGIAVNRGYWRMAILMMWK